MHWDYLKAGARSVPSSILRTRWRREGGWAGYKLTRCLLLVTSVQSSLVHCLQVPLPRRDVPSLPPCPTTGCIIVRSQFVVATDVLLPRVPVQREGAELPFDWGGLRTETGGCPGNGAGCFPVTVAPGAGFGTWVCKFLLWSAYTKQPMLTGTRLDLLRSNQHVHHTPREISPASPHNYRTRGYEGTCELMLIPDDIYAKKMHY